MDRHLPRVDAPSKQPGRQFSFDDWKKRGLCYDHPTLTTEDFYFESGTGTGRPSNKAKKEKAEKLAMLRALCKSCPVLAECEVLGRYEPFGFLAGKTEAERNGGKPL